MKAEQQLTRDSNGDVSGFDITCVVGHVDFTDTGEVSAHEAAFLVIARHDARGTFQFPMECGRMMSVTVDYPDYEVK